MLRVAYIAGVEIFKSIKLNIFIYIIDMIKEFKQILRKESGGKVA